MEFLKLIGALDIKQDYSLVLKRCSIKSIIKKETNEDEELYLYL